MGEGMEEGKGSEAGRNVSMGVENGVVVALSKT